MSITTEGIYPIPMLLWCPECGERHVDKGEFATKNHHTHACQLCGHVWRPAIIHTVGVQFLPGFKDKDNEPAEDGVIYRIKGRHALGDRCPSCGKSYLVNEKSESGSVFHGRLKCESCSSSFAQ